MASKRYGELARAGDWHGQGVRLLQDLPSGRFVVPKGALALVRQVVRGLDLEFDPCPHCGVRARITPALEQARIADVLSLARRAWTNMQSRDPDWRMPHDGYLKLYQLSSPDLSQYDYLMFDEAQDANPVTTAIVMAQKRCGVVMVGDPHQSIYQFRGARNAIEQAPATWPVLNLTRSFRFGPEVAEVANVLLALKGERTKVIGAGGVVPIEGRDAVWRVNLDSPYTVIARTNAGLLEQAFRSPESTLCWVGGLASYPLDRVIDVHALRAGNRAAIRDQSIAAFTSFDELSVYADQVEDVELKVLRRLVDEYGEDLPRLLESVRSRSVDDEKRAEIVLTTGHRSKGLEWNQVVLADDFIDLLDEGQKAAKAGLSGPLTPRGSEEINVLYVAVTRALQRIELPDSLRMYLGSRSDLDTNPIIQSALGGGRAVQAAPDQDVTETPMRRSRA